MHRHFVCTIGYFFQFSFSHFLQFQRCSELANKVEDALEEEEEEEEQEEPNAKSESSSHVSPRHNNPSDGHSSDQSAPGDSPPNQTLADGPPEHVPTDCSTWNGTQRRRTWRRWKPIVVNVANSSSTDLFLLSPWQGSARGRKQPRWTTAVRRRCLKMPDDEILWQNPSACMTVAGHHGNRCCRCSCEEGSGCSVGAGRPTQRGFGLAGPSFTTDSGKHRVPNHQIAAS